MNAWMNNIDRKFFLVNALIFMVCLALSMWMDNILPMGIPFALLLLPIGYMDIRYVFFMLVGSIPLSYGLDMSMDFPDEFFMLWISLLVVVMIILQYHKLRSIQFSKSPIFILVVLSVVWLFITCICSMNVALSFKFFLKKMWYLIPFFLLPVFLFEKRLMIIRTVQFLLFPLVIITLISLIRQGMVGFRFDMIYDPLQPFFLNHVIYGSMVSAALPLAVGALLLSRKLSMQWMFALGMIFIFAMATYFAYSRAAWVAVIFAIAVMVAIRFKIMHWAITGFYAFILCGVLWMANHNHFLSFKPVHDKTVMHETLEDHILATIQGTDISSAERYYRWIAALRMSQDNPWLGVGPNNFYDHYKAYTVRSFRTWVSRNPERSTTHNYFIFLLVEQGYPAMVLYALLYFMIFYFGQKWYHQLTDRRDKIILATAISVLAVIFINNFFSELLETDKIGSLFYLSLAVLVSYGVKLSLPKNHAVGVTHVD